MAQTPNPVLGASFDGSLVDAPAHDVQVLASELVATGYVWDVRRDRFVYGDVELERDYIDHPGAVAVVALDDAGRVLLIQQYRHPIAHRDWELPAGLMDVAGEPGHLAAARELAEEADLAAERWDLLIDMFLTPGGSSEAMRIFLARDVHPTKHTFVREAEEADMLTTWVPLEEAVLAVLEGRVKNAVTAGGILAAATARSLDWATLRTPDTPWPARDIVRGERSK